MKQKAGEPRIVTGATPAGVDGRLERLLDVEQQLEARVRGAEAEARGTVEAARAAAESADGEQRAEVEATALAEERADLERHAAELERIVHEGAARAAALRAVPDAEVLRLANKALAIVAGVDTHEAVPS
jgi:hypothetical protein